MLPWSSKESKFMTACYNGNAKRVRELLEEGAVDVNQANKYGSTPLRHALIWGHAQVVELLLQWNANVDAIDEKGRTSLCIASMRGYVRIVELLLQCNADVGATDKDGMTPLHCACYEGHVEVVKLLLQRNASVETTGVFGWTPLHFASSRSHVKVVELLLLWDANANATNRNGHRPVHLCLFQRENLDLDSKVLSTLRTLIAAGATWDATCEQVTPTEWQKTITPALRVCMELWVQEHVSGLPLTQVPDEVVKRGPENTQSYIDDAKISTEFIYRLKVCLVGPSCAGKTSLVKSILSGNPQLVHLDDRTIGIDHFPLEIARWDHVLDRKKVYKVTIGDFAGQDAYQVAHSLFFSRRTIYFVCIDLEAFTTAFLQASIMAFISKQEERLMDEFIERTVLQWVRMVLARQPMAEFVFIATKEDLIKENKRTEKLLKAALEAKLSQVDGEIADINAKQELQKKSQELDARTIEQNTSTERGVNAPLGKGGGGFLRTRMFKNKWSSSAPIQSRKDPAPLLVVPPKASDLLFVSSTSHESVGSARERIETLIVASERNVRMPYTYSRVLEAIGDIRRAARMQDITSRITQVFTPVDSLIPRLPAEARKCHAILQTLHDLGNILWYEDLGVELFRNTVILDPLLLIDFIRQVINHKHMGQTMPHAELIRLPYWMSLSDHKQTEAIKQVLHKFHLVYAADDDRQMRWDSDMIVPAYWQTKTPAAWLWLGDDLRINDTKSCEGEAVRVHWEFHFETGLPLALFSQVIVASVSAFFKFDAGPDWIVSEKKKIAACRILVGRDAKSLHRTIHVEAVVSQQATTKQSEDLWESFEHLCGSFFGVLKKYPGLVISSFAWDRDHEKIGLKRAMKSKACRRVTTWLPPPSTLEKLSQFY